MMGKTRKVRLYKRAQDGFIRPPRAIYDHSELGNEFLRYGRRWMQRHDLVLVNKEGKRLRCSHWIPLPLGFKPVQVSNAKKSSSGKAVENRDSSSSSNEKMNEFSAANSITAFAGATSSVDKKKEKNTKKRNIKKSQGKTEMKVDTSNQLEAHCESYPCIIYLHSNAGCRLGSTDVLPLAASYCASLFSFDFAGSGLSDGKYVSLGFHEQDDVDIVIRYLSNLKSVSRIVLWGRSMGAATSLLYGGKMGKIGQFFGSSHTHIPSFGLLCSSSLRYTDTDVQSSPSALKGASSSPVMNTTSSGTASARIPMHHKSESMIKRDANKEVQSASSDGDPKNSHREKSKAEEKRCQEIVAEAKSSRPKKHRSGSVKDKNSKSKSNKGKSESTSGKSRSHRDRSKSAMTRKDSDASSGESQEARQAITGTKYGTRRRSVLRQGEAKQRLSSIDENLVAVRKEKHRKKRNAEASASSPTSLQQSHSDQEIVEKNDLNLEGPNTSISFDGLPKNSSDVQEAKPKSSLAKNNSTRKKKAGKEKEALKRRESPLHVPAARGVRIQASPKVSRANTQEKCTSQLHQSDSSMQDTSSSVEGSLLSSSQPVSTSNGSGLPHQEDQPGLSPRPHRFGMSSSIGETADEPREDIVVGIIADSPFARLLPLVREMVNAACPKGTKSFMSSAASMTLKMLRQTIKKKANFDPKDVEPIHAAVISRLPLLLCHAEEDTIIPLHHAEDIFEVYGGDHKKLLTFPGDHNGVRRPVFFDEVSRFLFQFLLSDVDRDRVKLTKPLTVYGQLEEPLEWCFLARHLPCCDKEKGFFRQPVFLWFRRPSRLRIMQPFTLMPVDEFPFSDIKSCWTEGKPADLFIVKLHEPKKYNKDAHEDQVMVFYTTFAEEIVAVVKIIIDEMREAQQAALEEKQLHEEAVAQNTSASGKKSTQLEPQPRVLRSRRLSSIHNCHEREQQVCSVHDEVDDLEDPDEQRDQKEPTSVSSKDDNHLPDVSDLSENDSLPSMEDEIHSSENEDSVSS